MNKLICRTLPFYFITFTALAQGSLTPPGAPAPTMKSLAQVGPRPPISSAPFTLAQPGSYYLMANLNVTAGNANAINSNNVSLDLGGFTISSMETSPTGTGLTADIGNSCYGSSTSVTIKYDLP